MTAALSAENARDFILAGAARFTLVSTVTGTRYTYRVASKDDGAISFVSVLTGSDNESDYEYFGTIRAGAFAFGKPEKVRVSRDAPSAKAFAWAWPHIAAGRIPSGLEVYHEGRCARCARVLTVPESIESGFGPECAGRRVRHTFTATAA